MSDFTWYDAGTTTIGVNAEEVSQRLGELRRKTPAVIKVAVNATARETRKETRHDGPHEQRCAALAAQRDNIEHRR